MLEEEKRLEQERKQREAEEEDRKEEERARLIEVGKNYVCPILIFLDYQAVSFLSFQMTLENNQSFGKLTIVLMKSFQFYSSFIKTKGIKIIISFNLCLAPLL